MAGEEGASVGVDDVVVSFFVDDAGVLAEGVGVGGVLGFAFGESWEDDGAFGHAALDEFGHEGFCGLAVWGAVFVVAEVEGGSEFDGFEAVAPVVAEFEEVVGDGASGVSGVESDALECVGFVEFFDDVLLAGVVYVAELDAEDVDEVGFLGAVDDEFGWVLGVAEIAAEVVVAVGDVGGRLEGFFVLDFDVCEVESFVDAGEVVVDIKDGELG